MIVEYTVLEDLYRSKLVERVNDSIKVGWQPFGSLVVTARSHDVYYTQTLVKYEN